MNLFNHITSLIQQYEWIGILDLLINILLKYCNKYIIRTCTNFSAYKNLKLSLDLKNILRLLFALILITKRIYPN